MPERVEVCWYSSRSAGMPAAAAASPAAAASFASNQVRWPPRGAGWPDRRGPRGKINAHKPALRSCGTSRRGCTPAPCAFPTWEGGGRICRLRRRFGACGRRTHLVRRTHRCRHARNPWAPSPARSGREMCRKTWPEEKGFEAGGRSFAAEEGRGYVGREP